jgi:hypothetical protein
LLPAYTRRAETPPKEIRFPVPPRLPLLTITYLLRSAYPISQPQRPPPSGRKNALTAAVVNEKVLSLAALLSVFQQALLKRHPHHGCSRSLVN